MIDYDYCEQMAMAEAMSEGCVDALEAWVESLREEE